MYGQLDDLRIYNRAFSVQEATDLYIMTNQYATGECADLDYVLNPLTPRYKDSDGDRYGDGTFVQVCTQPTNYFLAANLIATGGDCNDLDGRLHPATVRYRDADTDGFSTGATATQCTGPTDYYLPGQLVTTSNFTAGLFS